MRLEKALNSSDCNVTKRLPSYSWSGEMEYISALWKEEEARMKNKHTTPFNPAIADVLSCSVV